MPIHETLSGHRIEYDDPDPELAAFLASVRAAADDHEATENELITLIYSADNPLLSPGLVPGQGVVTKETLAHPVYRVLQDLLLRKHVIEHGVDVEAMAARHTIGASEAAERLGVHVSAVRQAIEAQRLASWVKGGRHFIAPAALAAFELAKRGPKPRGRALRFRAGNAPGQSFRVKAPSSEVLEKKGKTVTAEVGEWQRIAVLSGSEGSYRFFEIEPVASGSERIAAGPFFVEGPFRIVRKVNNSREANREWKAFEPA